MYALSASTVGALDAKAEQVLGDLLDRDGHLLAAERLEVALAERMCPRLAVLRLTDHNRGDFLRVDGSRQGQSREVSLAPTSLRRFYRRARQAAPPRLESERLARIDTLEEPSGAGQ